MTFPLVLELYRTLRQELVRHGGEKAFPAIEGLPLPVAENDELSFMRLVVWSYSLIQENGRTSFRFLRELGTNESPSTAASILALRAWMTHNLSLSKDSDRRRMSTAHAWMRSKCGRHTQLNADDWRNCFISLCEELAVLLRKAIIACEILDNAEDGPRNIDELRRRVNKDWDAYLFDRLVQDSANRLGFEDLDIVEFRRRHLANWRRVLEVAADGTYEALLSQRIERDLLEWFGDALPLSCKQILQLLPLSGPELSVLLLRVRREVPMSRVQLIAFVVDFAEKYEYSAAGLETPVDRG